MGTPGQSQPKPVIELAPREKKPVQCPNCGKASEQVMPPISVINTESFSTIMVPHETPWQCPICGALFQCTLEVKGMSLHWITAIPNRNEIITPDKKIILPS